MGLLVVVVVGIGYFLFRSVSERVAGGGAYSLFARFRDASGLVGKSRVVIAGLTVGEIGERKLDGKLARVTVRLRPETEVYADAILAKKSSSLLGEYYLEIDPGSPEKVDDNGVITKNQRLKDGDEIKTVIEAQPPRLDKRDGAVSTGPYLAAEVRDLAAGAQGVSGPISHMAENSIAGAENSKVVRAYGQGGPDRHRCSRSPARRPPADQRQCSSGTPCPRQGSPPRRASGLTGGSPPRIARRTRLVVGRGGAGNANPSPRRSTHRTGAAWPPGQRPDMRERRAGDRGRQGLHPSLRPADDVGCGQSILRGPVCAVTCRRAHTSPDKFSCRDAVDAEARPRPVPRRPEQKWCVQPAPSQDQILGQYGRRFDWLR